VRSGSAELYLSANPEFSRDGYRYYEFCLDGVKDVSTFVQGNSTYAIFAASNCRASVQVVDVSDPSTPVAVGSAALLDVASCVGSNGERCYATAVSIFVRGGSTYAIVTATRNVIQLVDVSDPSSPVVVGSATDGEGGFTTLGGANDVSTFVRGDSIYAIVTAREFSHSGGIQLVSIMDCGARAVALDCLCVPADPCAPLCRSLCRRRLRGPRHLLRRHVHL
jgi:hypothetical protein